MLEEKEGKLKELLRMTGLSPVAYWLSWILAAGLKSLFLVVASSVVLLSTVPQADPLVRWRHTYTRLPLLSCTHPFPSQLIFIFLAAFSASTIAFACVVAAVFSKAKTGAGVGMLVFLVSYLPTVLAIVLGNPAAGLYSVDGLGGSTSPTGIETTATGHPTGRAIGFLFLSLLSPSAFAMGLVVVNDAEMVGNGGAKWGALNSRFSSVIPLPLGTLLLMLLLDTCARHPASVPRPRPSPLASPQGAVHLPGLVPGPSAAPGIWRPQAPPVLSAQAPRLTAWSVA